MHVDDLSVVHNADASRFEISLPDGSTALTAYRRSGDRIAFTHTEVPPQHEGEGVGTKLVREALDYARAHHLAVLPYCPFVRAFIEDHATYQDLVPSTFSG